MRSQARVLITECALHRLSGNRHQLARGCKSLRLAMIKKGFSEEDSLLIGLEAFSYMPD